MSMKRFLRRWPIVLALLLALLSAFSFWRMRAVPRLLPSQQAAERWKGDGERDFAQHSFFLPAEEKLTRDQIYSFRNDMAQKLKGASYDIEKEKGLYSDAWSLSAAVKVRAGQLTSVSFLCSRETRSRSRRCALASTILCPTPVFASSIRLSWSTPC